MKQIIKGIIIMASLSPLNVQAAKSAQRAAVSSAPHQLIDVTQVNSHFVLDIRYATNNNFTRQAVYPAARCFLHKTVATALSKVQQELELKGYGLKLFDGYRPLHVQQKMYDIINDARYVANPAKNNGKHTRGTAIDCTLVKRASDRTAGTISYHNVAMPTPFDDFSNKAHANATEGITQEQLNNRALLTTAMEKHGFKQLRFEWWHFDWEGGVKDGWKRFPALDVSFQQIAASLKK